MSSYRPIDSKREEFRKYLERTGVMDALTKALVALYEETDKPEDALGFIRNYLGGNNGGGGGGSYHGGSSDESTKGLQKQMEDLKVKSDKPDASVMKGSGDQESAPYKSEERHVGETFPVGPEGDASTVIPKDVNDIRVGDSELQGKQVAESMSSEAVA